jgi:hypothetical protein
MNANLSISKGIVKQWNNGAYNVETEQEIKLRKHLSFL